MKSLLYTTFFFLSFVLLFVIAKPMFMLYTGDLGQGAVFQDFYEVVWHGLPLDLCVAAFAALPVWLGSFVALFFGGFQRLSVRFLHSLRVMLLVYVFILSLGFSLALVADACLYPFWDIKLDATVLAYLDSPRGMTNSVSGMFMAVTFLAVVGLTILLYSLHRGLFTTFILRQKSTDDDSPQRRGYLFGAQTFLGIFLVLCIWGIHRPFVTTANDASLSVSTVYYSDRQVFNHAAVNPVFSFLTSVGDKARGISPDTFMDDDEADRIFAALDYNTVSQIAPEDSLLGPCDNIILVVMEGCGGTLVNRVCGRDTALTPHLNQLCDEGILFTECYANSFRTDRGLVCALSGYPSFPDLSVMRQDHLVQRLPGIARSLKKAGFTTDFLYGGDKDFTKMADYLRATGYDHVWGDTDFPEAARTTHEWGVTDHITFDRLYELVSQPAQKPRFTTFLTLASHEPWEVPYKRMLRKGKIANSFAYLDDCIGRFIERFKATPQWQTSLVIFIADHGIAWPAAIAETNTKRYHIPMIWSGGAVRAPRRIAQLCNQTDLPATLLGQLGLSHADFRFSRDVLSRTYRVPCAQHTWAEGITFIDATGATVLDIHSLKPLAEHDNTSAPADASALRIRKGEAFLQTAYRDLERQE